MGLDPPPAFGGGGFYAPTPEACETECYTRRVQFCNAWTFIPGKDGDYDNQCWLKIGADLCANKGQALKRNSRAISGFSCQ